MKPFIPPPPICAALPLQDAGKTIRKLIGLAVAERSTGAIAPSTLQKAGAVPAAGFQRGVLSVTAETGSPIADAGMRSPSSETVQSASVIFTSACGSPSAPEDQIRARRGDGEGNPQLG